MKMGVMSPSPIAQPSPPTPYEALGGEAGVRRLVDAFYDVMDGDPAAAPLRAMHAADLSPMRARLSDWLTGWMGGPGVYDQRHPGRPCIVSAHAALAIGQAESAQWMSCMEQAIVRADVPQDWRDPLTRAFAKMCQGLQTA